MATAAVVPFVSVDEYLHTSYEPDMDYIDGHIEDRNVGEFDHARIQRALLFALAEGEQHGGYFVVQEARMQVSPTRYRVPDTCILPAGQLPDRIIRSAPLLCIEVLSPEDRFSRVETKCRDYLSMGVPEVWIIDPQARTLHAMRGENTTRHQDGVVQLAGSTLTLDIKKLFSKLD
jgi:Uma2 family endonuclease